MEDDDLIVGRQPQIAFDTRAKLERGGKRKETVFRKTCPVMQAPVSEALGPRIERVRA